MTSPVRLVDVLQKKYTSLNCENAVSCSPPIQEGLRPPIFREGSTAQSDILAKGVVFWGKVKRDFGFKQFGEDLFDSVMETWYTPLILARS